MELQENENLVKLGPWGGEGGDPWDDGYFGAIRQILVGYGSILDSIQIQYEVDGRAVWGVKHGDRPRYVQKIMLNFPKEVLISISGYVGGLSLTCIHSLTFETNIRKYGPFGAPVGSHFSLPLEGGKVIGLYGKSGLFVNSIGVYYKPLKLTRIPNSWESAIATTLECLTSETADEEVDVMVKIRFRLKNYT